MSIRLFQAMGRALSSRSGRADAAEAKAKPAPAPRVLPVTYVDAPARPAREVTVRSSRLARGTAPIRQTD